MAFLLWGERKKYSVSLDQLGGVTIKTKLTIKLIVSWPLPNLLVTGGLKNVYTNS